MEPFPSKFISFLAIAVLLASCFSPLCIHARDIQYFSKATHTTTPPATTATSSNQLNKDPSTTTTTTPTEQEPSSAAVTELTADDQRGYGLYGRQSNYQYSPTTSNPTKETTYYDNQGRAVERQTTSNPTEETTYYDNQGRAVGRQGMSDTRFLENGKYFYDISKEVNNNDKFEFKNNMQNYQAEDEDEEEGFDDQDNEQIEEEDDGHGKLYNFENNNNKYYSYNGAEERQGMSDTKHLENGRYYYDIHKDKKSYNSNDNGFQRFSYGNNNNGYSAEEEVTVNRNSYPKQEKNPFDFRNTENKFPDFEFDSMEEYEKYQEQRAKQNGYRP